MRRVAREAGFALLSWLFPFVVSVGIYPLKKSQPLLFDTLMGVVVTCSTVMLAAVYFKRVAGDYRMTGLRIGLIWTITNWLLDGLMFSGGPMKMTFNQYVMDIGLAYLAIPAITIGLGVAANHAAKRVSQ